MISFFSFLKKLALLPWEQFRPPSHLTFVEKLWMA